MIIQQEKPGIIKSYSLIDGVDKIDVEYDVDKFPYIHYVTYYKKDEKFRLDAIDAPIYICNDQGKTLQIVKPYKENK